MVKNAIEHLYAALGEIEEKCEQGSLDREIANSLKDALIRTHNKLTELEMKLVVNKPGA